MDSLSGIIILVLPGFIALNFLRNIGPAENRPLSDYEKTVVGLLLNVPGLITSWAFLSLLHRERMSLRSFFDFVLSMPDFLVYIGVASVVGLLFAKLWDSQGRQLARRFIENHRQNNSRPKGSDKTPWEEFYGTEPSGFMRIYPIGERGKFVLGEVNNAFVPGEQDKGIYLSVTGELGAWDEWFGHPERTYVDTVTKVVYEMYPTSAWLEAQHRAQQSTSSS